MGIGTYMLLVNLCDLGVIIFLDFLFFWCRMVVM